MTERSLELLNEAMKLSPSERALLAAELAASLDLEGDAAPEADPKWLAEVERRIRQVQDGSAPGSDWESVELRIRERLRARRS